MSDTLNPEQIAIANLAVQLLPKIDLPDAWGTMHPHTLGKHISEPTTGKGVNFSESYESPQGWATPWELISEEAVKRARVLLDAAAGTKRQERIDYENASIEARQQMDAMFAQEEAWRVKFRRYAKTRSEITFIEALRLVLKSRNDEMLKLYNRECLREDRLSYRAKNREKNLPVVFADEAKGDQEQVVIKDLMDQAVDENWFGRLAVSIRDFYDTHGERIRKLHAKDKGSDGGKKTAQKKREKLAAEAAKYGGDSAPALGHAVDKKLKSAVTRRKKTKSV